MFEIVEYKHDTVEISLFNPDTETGLYYYHARYYDQNVERNSQVSEWRL